MTAKPSHLLVTGIHRSGTTWIGKMLAASGGLTYANEPLSVVHRKGDWDSRSGIGIPM